MSIERNLRENRASNYSAMFDLEDEDLTPGERNDMMLRDMDSSTSDPSVSTFSSESSETYSPEKKKAKNKEFKCPFKKDGGGDSVISPGAGDIPETFVNDNEDEDKENVDIFAPSGSSQGSHKRVNLVPGAMVCMYRQNGVYSTERLIIVVKKTSECVEQQKMSFEKVLKRFQELVIKPLLLEGSIRFSGKRVKDFSYNWSRILRDLVQSYSSEDKFDLKQFTEAEMTEVTTHIELLIKSSEADSGDTGRKGGSKDAFLDSGIEIILENLYFHTIYKAGKVNSPVLFLFLEALKFDPKIKVG